MKVLTRRIVKVPGEVTGEYQSVFVEGRNNTNVFLVANQVVYDLLYHNRYGILSKLKMERTYNHVNWVFIDYMLMTTGFGGRWCKWINSYITMTSFAVLLKRWTLTSFKATRGLRQGDLLAPLFFIIAMKALNMLMMISKEEGLLRELKVEGGEQEEESIHLIFSNYTLVFYELDKNAFA